MPPEVAVGASSAPHAAGAGAGGTHRARRFAGWAAYAVVAGITSVGFAGTVGTVAKSYASIPVGVAQGLGLGAATVVSGLAARPGLRLMAGARTQVVHRIGKRSVC
jgi:hypothetical protein